MIRVGIIGYGYRGQYLAKLISQIEEYNLVAIADPFISNAEVKANFYAENEDSYQDMLNNEALDLVVVASPWEFHYKHVMASINKECDVALEVKGALFEGEYEDIIIKAKEKQVKIYPLENAVFMKNIMAVWEMIKKGLFGKIIYGQGGYRHDLRALLLDSDGKLKDKSKWRIDFYHESYDRYPTHGIGPIAIMLDVNRTDKFKSLTSFASKGEGIKQKLRTSLSPENLIFGADIISTTIETINGVLINLFHDTTLPRPKTLSYEIQGTKGIWNWDLKSIYIEGVSPHEQWEEESKYVNVNLHPFWKKWGSVAEKIDAHHQGMDYIMLKVLAEDKNKKENYPITIDDIRTWANISIWSKKSIKNKSSVIILDC